MSWQATSFLILAFVLVGGMLWYERSRPPSQVVALVAVLAALAVAGRIALAPIPNVVATTDIVMFAGYALGPAPGFAVGALGGLISNFWLGQGPWTPWQMACWGMTGVLGGALFLITRGRAGRFTLAAAGAFAGVAFGAVMNFQTMVAFGGEMSLERYLALEVRAIPFDLAHAAGNVAFALIAGPAMVAALRRFKDRFEWRQAGAVAGAALLAVVVVGAFATAPAEAAEDGEMTRLDRAQDWLLDAQNSDGGFGNEPDAPSNTAVTGWTTLGIAASGLNPLDAKGAGKSPYAYLKAAISDVRDASDLSRTIVALNAAGLDPKDFAGQNLVKRLREQMWKNGSFQGWTNTTAVSIIALESSGIEEGLEQSKAWLRDMQHKDGGWGITPQGQSDPDTTGMVLQVVTAQESVDKAVRYLKQRQAESGGWGGGGAIPVNAQSTARVIQGLAKAGRAPNSIRRGGNSGLDYLYARQEEDGHFSYSKGSDQTPVWVTATVMPAIAKVPFPIEAPDRLPEDDEEDTDTSTSSDTGGSTYTPSPSYSTPSTSTGSGSSFGSGSSNSGSGSGTGSGTGSSSGSSTGTDDGFTGEDDSLTPDETTVPTTPVAPPSTATATKLSQASAPLAIAIGLAVTALAIGITLMLARRFRW